MLVAMKWQMSGGRHDDRPWPPAGAPFEVPDWEGTSLIAGGMADPADDSARKAAESLGEQPAPGHPSKLDPRPAPAPEPARVPVPEPAVKPDPEPAVKTDPEPAVKSDPEPAVKSDPEPAVKADPEPAPVPEPLVILDNPAAVPGEPPPVTLDNPAAGSAAEAVPPVRADPEPVAETPVPSSPKQAWIEFAVSQGADIHAASSMTKADLMSRYGGRL